MYRLHIIFKEARELYKNRRNRYRTPVEYKLMIAHTVLWLMVVPLMFVVIFIIGDIVFTPGMPWRTFKISAVLMPTGYILLKMRMNRYARNRW